MTLLEELGMTAFSSYSEMAETESELFTIPEFGNVLGDDDWQLSFDIAWFNGWLFL